MREEDFKREFKVLGAALAEVLTILKAERVVLRSVITIKPKPKGTTRMETTIITTEQNALITITPETAAGKPTTVDGIPVWETSDPQFTLVPAADGMSCEVQTPDDIADGASVQIDVTVSVDADRGAGVRTVSLVFPFVLSLPEATSIVGSVTLTNKP
jgi:hypothetical protein